MVAIGPLTVRLDLLAMLVSLLVLYVGLTRFGLTDRQRDAVLFPWFAGFLAWKGSAILIGWMSTQDIRLALYATGGMWSILVAFLVIAWLSVRLDSTLRGYAVFSGLVLWFATTLVVPTYGAFPWGASSQPLHLYTALFIGVLAVSTWRWMRSPSIGAIAWTVLAALLIRMVVPFLNGQAKLWWVVPIFILLVVSLRFARPSRRLVQYGMFALVVMAVLYAGFPQDKARLETSASTGLNIGQVPPSFSLLQTDGTTFDIEAARGKPVVLNFWASWCPPCRAEMPDLATFAEERNDVTVVAINTTTSERDVEAARSFVAPYEEAFTVVYDSEGAVADAYRVQAMPTTYVLDASGTIIAKQYGAIDRAWLDRFVD